MRHSGDCDLEFLPPYIHTFYDDLRLTTVHQHLQGKGCLPPQRHQPLLPSEENHLPLIRNS